MSEPIRPAATVILWRDTPQGAQVLMGQRGSGAVFMPSKFVFPGGAVDPEDMTAHTAMRQEPLPLSDLCRARLDRDAPVPAAALVAAALRELTLSPISSMASGGGPMNATPLAMMARAKSAFSEKKP